MEEKIKHLEMIQCVITRMSNCSFALKGWTVTLEVALLALIIRNNSKAGWIVILAIPILFFWVLDSYYLYLEKLYRELYDKTRLLEYKDIDFNMKANQMKQRDKISLFCGKCLFSKSEVGFYIPLIIIVLVIICFPI